MTVDELWTYCQQHWERHREEFVERNLSLEPCVKGRNTQAWRQRDANAGHTFAFAEPVNECGMASNAY